jgi:uncharacterized RDD family membrane protein YckC
MTCLLCGDICRCSSAELSAASPRWLADDECVSTATPQAMLETPQQKESGKEPIAEAPQPCDDVEPVPEDSPAWRLEVAARLNRYQERRKPRPPRYPSLRLRFEGEDPNKASAVSMETVVLSPSMSSNRALALDGFADSAVHAVEASASAPPEVLHAALPQPLRSSPVPVTTAKIIEFPRSWTPPPASPDELAEPVMNRPRILEAPEVLPPLPALGGIAIDPAPQPELGKRPGIDIPLQSASLARRVCSAAIDDAIIAMACALFGLIFWKVTAIRPPGIQILEIAVGLTSVLWAAYQYLLLVYAGTTPGLRMAGLELARFDGSPAGRRLRRWRVLASYLSAVSLGMGYAWVFLDEDALCWHDRITHTYIAPKV